MLQIRLKKGGLASLNSIRKNAYNTFSIFQSESLLLAKNSQKNLLCAPVNLLYQMKHLEYSRL